MSLIQCFIPILSYWEWEICITIKVYARIGLVLHNNQLSAEPLKELRSPGHLLTAP